MGRRGDEEGRPGERPSRAGQGAALGARSRRARRSSPRRGTPMVMLGLGNSVGTPPAGVEGEVLVVRSFQELDAAGPKVARPDRAVQRAVHELRRDGAVSGRWSVTRRGARRDRGAGALGRSARPAHAAYRRAALCRRAAANPGRGRHGRRRRAAAADAGPRHAAPCPAQDGGALPPRRRLRQRRRRDPRPRAARRSRASSAATSIRGTSAAARPTMAAGAW